MQNMVPFLLLLPLLVSGEIVAKKETVSKKFFRILDPDGHMKLSDIQAFKGIHRIEGKMIHREAMELFFDLADTNHDERMTYDEFRQELLDIDANYALLSKADSVDPEQTMDELFLSYLEQLFPVLEKKSTKGSATRTSRKKRQAACQEPWWPVRDKCYRILEQPEQDIIDEKMLERRFYNDSLIACERLGADLPSFDSPLNEHDTFEKRDHWLELRKAMQAKGYNNPTSAMWLHLRRIDGKWLWKDYYDEEHDRIYGIGFQTWFISLDGPRLPKYQPSSDDTVRCAVGRINEPLGFTLYTPISDRAEEDKAKARGSSIDPWQPRWESHFCGPDEDQIVIVCEKNP